MKATGIVRPIDNLGRFVIPKEMRDVLNVKPKDSLEIFVEEEKIILKKYQPTCSFCYSADNLTYFKGKLVCAECVKGVKSLN